LSAPGATEPSSPSHSSAIETVLGSTQRSAAVEGASRLVSASASMPFTVSESMAGITAYSCSAFDVASVERPALLTARTIATAVARRWASVELGTSSGGMGSSAVRAADGCELWRAEPLMETQPPSEHVESPLTCTGAKHTSK